MMKHPELRRREFLRQSAMGMGALAGAAVLPQGASASTPPAIPDYDGPNVILVRFGGGVRRRETIDTHSTYSPYFLHELAPRGTLYTNMVIDQFADIQTSHGEGTLYLLTGKYDRFKDVDGRFLGGRFESKVPTLFEYLRKVYNVPTHQTLIINGEDRTDEEFYSFSNHHLFGAEYRSATLSLYRYKVHLLRRLLASPGIDDAVRAQKKIELAELESIDFRLRDSAGQAPPIQQFWDDWRALYGDSGFVNARGDRLLTQLAIRALDTLHPRLMMINYNDPDYVHWGNPAHYTRGIAIIDQGLQELVTAIEVNDEYRDNTVFVIVPDCGRDSNRAMEVPFQHHFNSRTAHEIFALFFGPGIARGKIIDREVQQVSVAATVGHLMNMPTGMAEGPALGEVFA